MQTTESTFQFFLRFGRINKQKFLLYIPEALIWLEKRHKRFAELHNNKKLLCKHLFV